MEDQELGAEQDEREYGDEEGEDENGEEDEDEDEDGDEDEDEDEGEGEDEEGKGEKVAVARDKDPFQIIVDDYHRVTAQLEYEEDMDDFLVEYKKMYEALVESHNTEKAMRHKCNELEMEIITNQLKIDVAEKLTSSDKETIDELKKEVEKSWRLVDAAHLREQNAHEAMEALRTEVARLTKELEVKSRMGAEQEDSLASKGREGMARERERLITEVNNMRDRLKNTAVYQEELERKNSAAELKIDELTQELEAQETETAKELRLKERMESELRELQAAMEQKETELGTLSGQMTHAASAITRLEATVKELKASSEKLSRENDVLAARSSKLQSDNDRLQTQVERQHTFNKKMKLEMKLRSEELGRLQLDAQKMAQTRDTYFRKLQQAVQARDMAEGERERLRTIVIRNLEHELALAQQTAETDRRSADNLAREKDLLSKTLSKCQDTANEHTRVMRLQEQVKRNLEIEIDQYMAEAGKQRKIINTLERERDRYIMQSTELTAKLEDTQEEVRLKQQAIFEFKKQIAESVTRYRQQQNLYEAVRADRNTFAKHLLEAQEEIGEVKHKLKVQGHHVEQLKEDIAAKETQLLREQFALEKSEKEKEALRLELQQARDELTAARQKLAEMQAEERRLLRIIQEADDERRRQTLEMEQMMNERDILGTQLVRRNDELSLLYEKIRILQSTLQKGEQQYDQRLEDIRLLKLEVKRLRTEKGLLARSVANMGDLRQEMFHLERDLTRERLKCRALEEELQNPLNVHRWRKLQGSDPTAFELVQKVHLLQKRLLAQATLSIERENQLREAERLYLGLRQLLARQPGPETAARLHRTQQALRERGRKMKALVSELNMYESQVAEYKFDLERVTGELNELKKKFFAQKKREHRLAQDKRAAAMAAMAAGAGSLMEDSTGVVLPLLADAVAAAGAGSLMEDSTGVVLPLLADAVAGAGAGAQSDVRRFTGGGFGLTKPQPQAARS